MFSEKIIAKKRRRNLWHMWEEERERERVRRDYSKQRKPRVVGITLVLTLHFAASPAARRVSILPTCAIIVLRQSQMLLLAMDVGESSLTDLTPAQQLRDTTRSSPITYGTHIPNAVCATPQSVFVCPSTSTTTAAITKVMATTIHKGGGGEEDMVNVREIMTTTTWSIIWLHLELVTCIYI